MNTLSVKDTAFILVLLLFWHFILVHFIFYIFIENSAVHWHFFFFFYIFYSCTDTIFTFMIENSAALGIATLSCLPLLNCLHWEMFAVVIH